MERFEREEQRKRTQQAEFDNIERHAEILKQIETNKKKMEIQGNIKLIGETETFGSGFKKRQIVLTTDEMYPQDIAIDFIKDNTEMLNLFRNGQNATVSINVRGNEFNSKYYVSLQGWKIVLTEVASDLP